MMLQITPQHRLMIAVSPVDFRRGIDGLAALCRTVLNQNPFDGYLFAFRNRSGTAIKLLNYDGNGFWLCQKRFSKGKLKWWPSTSAEAMALKAVELLVILQQGLPQSVALPEDWHRLPQLPLIE
jgi:transposase